MKMLKEYNCVVGIIDGHLSRCKIKSDGGPDMWGGSLNWEQIKPPVDEKFLVAVNLLLGTKFTKDDFKLPEPSTE